VTVADVVSGAIAGNPRDVGRLLTLIENDPRAASEFRRQAPDPVGMVIGLTGPPGVGKSTTTAALIAALRERDVRVAVLAIDPSSPFSGGALLGDRIRMQHHATDEHVFIRSMAARGQLGGLAAAAPAVMDALLRCGFDAVLVETVGVGQSEMDIAGLADTTVVLLSPGAGDGVQAAKAGILEVGDVFVVNKADREGADATTRELRTMIDLGQWSGWVPPVVKTVAATGEGIEELLDVITAHTAWLRSTGQRTERRRTRIRAEVAALVTSRVNRALEAGEDEALLDDVSAGRCDAAAAADAVLRRIGGGGAPV
jgi:LAO/AO transport system kinase